MITFNTVRAFGVRPGDKMPAPLPWGGWDRSKALVVTQVGHDRSVGYCIFTLETGETVRALSMNVVPFLKSEI